MTVDRRTPTTTVRGVFIAIDAGDPHSLLGLLADDVHFRFGNAEPIEGKAAFSQFCAGFFASIAGIRHTIHDLWQIGDDTVVSVMDVWYRRLDGQELTLPCCNVFRLTDGQVRDYRIFMDISPLVTN